MIPPLSGPDKQIHDLLEAGRTFDDVCAIGAYRKAWRPSAVHRLANQRAQPPKPKPVRTGRSGRSGPLPMELEHGTESGYRLHVKRKLPTCAACRAAHTNTQRERRNRSA